MIMRLAAFANKWKLAFLAVILTRLAVADGALAAPDCPPAGSTLELLQRAIFERRGCNISHCHGAEVQGGLDLRAGSAYDTLLGGGFVVPGKPDESLLWLALAKKTLSRPSIDATAMPKDGLALSRDELEAIRLWILDGAPPTGEVAAVKNLVSECAPRVAYAVEAINSLPQCKRNDPQLLLPSLFADPPSDVRVFTREGKRRVEFTTRVGNTGDGPLIIQAETLPAAPGHTVNAMQVIMRRDGTRCARRAGTMRLSESGDRWQFGNFFDFELRLDDPVNGPVLAYAGKPAYCLVDSDPIHPDEAWPHQYELHCTDVIGRMGISVGYKDTYSRQHPMQWLDLDTDPELPIDRGTYYLLNIADPSNHIWEKNDKRDDNMNYTAFRVGLRDPDAPPSNSAIETTPDAAFTPTAGRPPRPPRAPVAHPTRAERPPRPTLSRP
jgi:hypothetical protein